MTIFGRMKWFLPLLMTVGAASVSAQYRTPSLDLLKRYLTGSFTNAAKAVPDSVRHPVLDLEMRRIWLRDPDGVWLYEERIERGKKDRTWLQGIHHLTQRDDSTWVLTEHRLDSLHLFAGAYRDIVRFNGVGPSDTRPLPGCEVVLQYRDGRFVGGTMEQRCKESGEGSTNVTVRIDAGPDDLLFERAVGSAKPDGSTRFRRKPRAKATMPAVGQ